MNDSKIACNLADLTRYDAIVRSCLVAPIVNAAGPVIKTGPNLDDGAVLLQTTEERALAVVGFLRNIDKRHRRYVLRAYVQGSRGGWSSLRPTASPDA